MVLCEKRNQNKLKYKKMQKKYISPKLWLTVNQKKKLRKIVRKREKVLLYPYFHPQVFELWECILVEWAFALKFNNKSAEECLKTIGPKLNPKLASRKNWERSWEREKRFSCTHITTSWLQNCENVSWLNVLL